MQNLYKARIEKIKNIEDTYDRRLYEIDTHSFKNIRGIVDGEYIYDLESDNRYIILKKSNGVTIDKDADVVIGNEYATNIEICHKLDIPTYLKMISLKLKINSNNKIENEEEIKTNKR